MEEDRATNQRSAFPLFFKLALYISNRFGLSLDFLINEFFQLRNYLHGIFVLTLTLTFCVNYSTTQKVNELNVYYNTRTR